MSLMPQMSKTWSLDLRNGWTDFDEIWYACRPCRGMLKFKISVRSVRWGLSYDRAKIGFLAGRDGWALLGETTVSPDEKDPQAVPQLDCNRGRFVLRLSGHRRLLAPPQLYCSSPSSSW